MPGLDGVRGIAVSLVLLYHFAEFSREYAVRDPRWLQPFVRGFSIASHTGWVGVEMFFVLSGFLITGILMRAKESPSYFRLFYARRALRILPAYYAVLLIHLVILTRLDLPDWANLQFVVVHQAWYWGFLTNFLYTGTWHRLTSHLWTIAVEEQFYLVWPIVVWFLGRVRLMRVCLLILAGGAALRLVLFVAGAPARASYLMTPTDLDCLAGGAWLALVGRQPVTEPFAIRYGRQLTVIALAILGGLFVWRRGFAYDDRFVPLIGFSCFAVVFGAVTFQAANAEATSVVGRALRIRTLRFLGRYSYAIYLLHMPIIQLWSAPQRGETWLVSDGVPPFLAHLAYIVVVTAAIIAAALMSWHLIEQPFLRLRPQSGPAT